MKVIMKRPGEAAQIGELMNSEFREYVGGSLETVRIINSKYRVVCNDCFLLDDSKYNCTIDNTDYFGNIFICSTAFDEDGLAYDLEGLNDKDIKIIQNWLLTEGKVIKEIWDYCPGDRVRCGFRGSGTVIHVDKEREYMVVQLDGHDRLHIYNAVDLDIVDPI